MKLGQPVALKFLPQALASDPVRRERFFAEVRITRQLAHPDICRVFAGSAVIGLFFGLAYLVLLVFLRILLRRDWLAFLAFVVVRSVPSLGTDIPWISVPIGIASVALALFTFQRFELFGFIASAIVYGVFFYPITFQTSAWYAGGGFVALGIVAGLSLYGFRTSLGSRRIFDLAD